MTAQHENPVPCDNKETSAQTKKNISMHDDIPVWYDCCSCEAEPYWLEAMESDGNDDNKDAK